MLDHQNIVDTYERYAYLICQGSLWEDMDANRRDDRIKVTKVTMMQDEKTKLYENVQKLRSKWERAEMSGRQAEG